MIVDLRSDTVTRPTPEMFEAMRTAALGDDVLGDDPTVAELEALAATVVAKESALFVPSGTMGNQIAIASWCKPGDAILVEEEAHMLYYEVGASAVLSGVVNWTLPSDRGAMDPERLRSRILKGDLHTPGTTLICLENTHNRAGGAVIPQAVMRATADVAARQGVRIHLDGARVFNAAVAQGIPVSEITQYADSVNFCLSKGLRSPVGSLLSGPADFIDRARIWRKRLGGGMRQAGLLAACGLVSLRTMVGRLSDDHRRAKDLAMALSAIPGLRPDATIDTNIVRVETDALATEWQARMHERGVRFFPISDHRFRLVTHADVGDAAIAEAVKQFARG